MRTEDTLLAHYNQHESYYSPITSAHVFDTFVFRSKIKLADKSVLDIGCGDGRLYPLLRKYNIKNYTGVDYSEVRIKKAQKAYDDVNFVCSKMQSFLGNSADNYDVAFVFEVLEHLENPVAAISLLKKHTKCICGSVPLNHTYHAHLHVYGSTKEVTDKLHVSVLWTYNNHAFFFNDCRSD